MIYIIITLIFVDKKEVKLHFQSWVKDSWILNSSVSDSKSHTLPTILYSNVIFKVQTHF